MPENQKAGSEGHGETVEDGLEISNNSISGNSGGGILCSWSSGSIMNNKILTNTDAGGIYCYCASPSISNNVIAGNGASMYGGGIYSYSGSPVILNNTILANSAGRDGGGVYCNSSPAQILNNLVAFNSSGIASPSLITLRNNCVYNPGGYDYSGMGPGAGDFSEDPQVLGADYGQIHLTAGSPCRDAGDDTVVHAGWTDIDGQSRIQGEHVDIGADEFSGTTPSFTPKCIRVSSSGDDANDGSGWASAKRTVQAGIDAAASTGGEVWVAAGTYDERIVLRPWVYVYGGFAGTESSLNQRDRTTRVSVLDGAAAGSVVSALSGGMCGVDGFTIRNGTGTLRGGVLYGGGIYCRCSLLRISNNTITGNAASSGYGGGICCDGCWSLISNNTISGNTAGPYGGGICCFTSTSLILNNVIRGNIAANGGGINGGGGSTVAANNIIVGNRALSSGGGMRGGSGIAAPTVINCTFSGNSAPSGAGVYINSTTSLALANCVLWGNNGPQITCPIDGTSILTYCDVQGGWAGTGNTNTDPRFVRNPNPGEDGLWGTADDDYGDLHLRAGSPCIDAGNNAALPADVLTDLDGRERLLDDPATTDCPFAPGTCGMAPIVDMGAYEFRRPDVPILADFDHDGDVDAIDIDRFRACMTGTASGPPEPGCEDADLDRNGDVDQSDFGIMQRCVSGEGIMGNPSCS